MRVDGKAESPRQSMAWLHTWSSLILGWLLYAIFLTGTLSFFQNEISVWMKPEVHQSVPPVQQQQQIDIAVQYLQQHHADAGSWTIQLPNERQPVTTLSIRQQGEDPNARRGGTRLTLDSATGEVLEPRETRGGGFLYRFHFELYGLERTTARWIVGIATIFMLVAIISGIITHKKIFKDFFTFRSGKGQRSWLDAHNATAVFALPFHIMITVSGLLLLLFTLMPWGVNQIYENRQEFLQDQRRSLVTDQKEQRLQQERPSSEQRAERRRDREQSKEKVLMPAVLADLKPMVIAAQNHFGSQNQIGSITIVAPNTTQAMVKIQALYSPSVVYRGVYDALEFNGVTGAAISNSSTLKTPSVATGIYNSFTVLHEARGVNLSFRWLLFFSGIMGTLMIATGLILWCVKRAPQQFKQGKKSFGYRIVEVTNIAAVIGLPIACAAYFYANRLIPATLEQRSGFEIKVFFVVWFVTLVHASLRAHRKAWLEQLFVASCAFALLPLINGMTGGQPLWVTIPQGQWVIATFDLAMWVLALVFILAFKKVKIHKNPMPKIKQAKTSAEDE